MRKILVVDDNDLVLEAICNLLKQNGYNVTAINRGDLAIAEINTKTFDIAVLDLKIPGIGGFEILEEIRSIEKERGYARMPVIIMTAFSDEINTLKNPDVAFDEYIIKPFEIDDFLKCIKKHLSLSKIKKVKG